MNATCKKFGKLRKKNTPKRDTWQGKQVRLEHRERLATYTDSARDPHRSATPKLLRCSDDRESERSSREQLLTHARASHITAGVKCTYCLRHVSFRTALNDSVNALWAYRKGVNRMCATDGSTAVVYVLVRTPSTIMSPCSVCGLKSPRPLTIEILAMVSAEPSANSTASPTRASLAVTRCPLMYRKCPRVRRISIPDFVARDTKSLFPAVSLCVNMKTVEYVFGPTRISSPARRSDMRSRFPLIS